MPVLMMAIKDAGFDAGYTRDIGKGQIDG